MADLTIKGPPGMVQPTLLDVPQDSPFKSPGSARTHYGATVQSLVAELLGLREIQGSGMYDVVFDAYNPITERYAEIKSVHESNKCPVYVWRIKKDRDSGVDPVYLFAMHRVRGAKSVEDVKSSLEKTMTRVIALSLSTVEGMVKKGKVRQLVKKVPGSRVGYERAGYCEGYVNIPTSDIADAACLDGGVVRREVWGRLFEVNLLLEDSCRTFFA